jgi:hypothetical protein
MRKHWYFLAPAAILGMMVFVFLGGGIVKQLWNWLLPSLFGFHEITFWKALGMLLLCRILFGGFGFRGSSRSSGPGFAFRRRMADHVADRVGDRWDAMTPEERERFRQRILERCGFDPSTSKSKEQ